MRNWLSRNVFSILALAVFFGGNAIAAILITEFTDPPTHNNGTVTVSTVTIPVRESQGIGTHTIHPCPTEDSDNCYWNAETMGNGKGMSFVTIDGQTYYLAGN